MKVSISHIVNIINNGYFAFPLINYILSEDISREIYHYLLNIRYIWYSEYDKALEEITEGLKHCSNLSLKYLFLSDKSFLLNLTGNFEEEKIIHNQLVSEFDKIPENIRVLIAQHIIATYHAKNDKEYKNIRHWSKKYEDAPGSKAFLLFSHAQEYLNKNDINKAIEIYKQGYECAKKGPHVGGILTGANNIAWFLKDTDLVETSKYIYDLAFYIGYYFENIYYNFYNIDTIFIVEEMSDDLFIFETASIIAHIVKYQDTDNPFTKSRLEENDCYKLYKKYKVSLNSQTCKNCKRLIDYLKNLIKNSNLTKDQFGISKSSLYSILNGETKEIDCSTLRKILRKTMPDISLNMPQPVIAELIKIKLEDDFNIHIGQFKALSNNEKIIKFMEVYMSMLERAFTHELSEVIFLILKDFDVFYEKYGNNFHIMYIINNIFNKMHPFYEARKTLVHYFLDTLHKNNNLYFFIGLYLNAKDDEKLILDTFIRNYSRYRLEWKKEMPIVSIKKLKKMAEIFGLDEKYVTISYFAIEKEEDRKKFLSII